VIYSAKDWVCVLPASNDQDATTTADRFSNGSTCFCELTFCSDPGKTNYPTVVLPHNIRAASFATGQADTMALIKRGLILT
jgi:hypothetical protein